MSRSIQQFSEAFAACPLVAVLRGLTPAEAPDVGEALAEAGFTMIEVPLNSPDPFESIAILAARLAGRALVGAGTVISVDQVSRVGEAGGTLIVSPDVNTAVIEATVAAGLISLPGFFTPTEGFTALAAGAMALKLFPADAVPPAMLKAQRAVLPKATRILAVGGIVPETMVVWREAGADGFGLGSNLYRPGKSVAEVGKDAASFISALRKLP